MFNVPCINGWDAGGVTGTANRLSYASTIVVGLLLGLVAALVAALA